MPYIQTHRHHHHHHIHHHHGGGWRPNPLCPEYSLNRDLVGRCAGLWLDIERCGGVVEAVWSPGPENAQVDDRCYIALYGREFGPVIQSAEEEEEEEHENRGGNEEKEEEDFLVVNHDDALGSDYDFCGL